MTTPSQDRAEILRHAEDSRIAILERTWVSALAGLNAEPDPVRKKALAAAEAAAKRALDEARAPATATPQVDGPGRTYLNRAAALASLPPVPGRRRDVYKNRREAFDDFVLAELPQPVSRATFYDHCKTVPGLLQADKTVWLADLENWVKEHLKIDPSTKRLLEDRQRDDEREQRIADLELRRLEAETLAKERSNRRDDDNWIEKGEHDIQMGAFAARVDEALRQGTSLRLAALVHACGGDPARAPELAAALEELHAEAMTDAVALPVQTLVFEAEAEARG